MNAQQQHPKHKWSHQPARQAGGLLIVGMILLVVLTVIGLAAGGTSSLQLKMSSNSLEKNASFQYAENAIAVAEKKAIELADAMRWIGGTFDCTTGYYALPTAPKQTGCTGLAFPANNVAGLDPKNFDWNNAVVVSGTNARYVIEYMGAYNDITMRTDAARGTGSQKRQTAFMFRVTARGGANNASYTYLQEIYMRV
jgi:type IV pilus assembly protein PilX